MFSAEVSGVAEFVAEILAPRPSPYSTDFAYRGQKDSGWARLPGILRNGNEPMLHAEPKLVREMVSTHPWEFRDDKTMFDKLARVQHFGLPTRLLDITRNPLVALFFASEPADNPAKETDGLVECYAAAEVYYDDVRVSIKANLANLTGYEKEQIAQSLANGPESSAAIERLLRFVRVEHPDCDLETVRLNAHKKVFVIPKLDNRRLIAQSGAFLLFGIPYFGYDADRYVSRITVLKEHKRRIREELNKLGINVSTLFPELERTADAIKSRYQQWRLASSS